MKQIITIITFLATIYAVATGNERLTTFMSILLLIAIPIIAIMLVAEWIVKRKALKHLEKLERHLDYEIEKFTAKKKAKKPVKKTVKKAVKKIAKK